MKMKQLFPSIRLDLAILTFCLGSVTVAHSQMNYSLQPAPFEFTGSQFALVQVADINGDGHLDIIAQLSGAGSPITYAENDGNGGFTTPASHPFSDFNNNVPTGYMMSNTTTEIADFDSDGDLDIWTRVSGANNDFYLRNDNGVYSLQPAPFEFTGNLAALGRVGDFNGDGHVDIIALLSGTSGPITFAMNDGSGGFTTPATHPFSDFNDDVPTGYTIAITSTDIADFDGDGDLDIWTRVNGLNNDFYLRNDNGVYSLQPAPFEYTGSQFTLGQVADFNGDGYVDIVVQLSGAGTQVIYAENDGTGVFTTPVLHPFSDLNNNMPAGYTLTKASTLVVDLDSDGDFDIWTRVNGIANDVYLQGSGEAPVLVGSIPANNATDVGVDQNITLNFNENVVTGNGNIYIRQFSDSAIIHAIAANSAAVSGSGTSALTIDPPADLATNTTYFITFDRNAISDADDGLIFGFIDPFLKVRAPYTSNDLLRFSTSTSNLPVDLLNFSVIRREGKALLEWQTAREQNSTHFIVQRSMNSVTWNDIGTVAAAGNSTSLVNYSFVDREPLKSRQFYRLVQVDADGSQHISPVRTLADTKSDLAIYPNPTKDVVFIRMPENGQATVVLYNMSGQEVLRQITDRSTVQISVSDLPAATYKIVIDQNEQVYTETLIRQ